MKNYPLGVAVLTLVGLIALAASAGIGPPRVGAPAPLLAAGIPAFLALGGGVLATKLIRRFRNPRE